MLLAQIPDMVIQKALAPPNPIVDYGFAGFTFSPHQKFYSMFKNGVLAKLAVRNGLQSYVGTRNCLRLTTSQPDNCCS